MIRWCVDLVPLVFLNMVFAISSWETGFQKDLELWWMDLGSADGAKAYVAMGKLAAASAAAVGWLQLPVPLNALLMEVKVLFILEPIVVTAVMHTTMIKANMIAYSTAAGPSSHFKNSQI
jgi:hypothetical protein